jgi:surface protein
LESISGIENLKTDNVTDMSDMFYACSSLTSLDLRGLKTANVTDMHTMFLACSSLSSLNVSSFNTANVQDMYGMFSACSGLTSLDLHNFDVSNVENMQGMFGTCSNLTSLDLSGFNTANVKIVANMFMNCSNLMSLDISSFDVSNVLYPDYMFSGCTSLTSLDLSSFNTANAKSMNEMFSACSALKTIYVGSGWSTAEVVSAVNMFNGCTSLVGGMGTVFDENHVDASYAHLDGGPSNPGYLTLALSMGDANGDGSINIADAVATVTNILGQPTEENFYKYAADMNNDSVIDIFDVTMIVNAALAANTPAPAITRSGTDEVPAEAIQLMADTHNVYMDIDQAQQYTALQFDMDLPEGTDLLGVRLLGDTDHQLSFVKRGDSQYRVIALSMNNEVFRSANGHLIQLQVSNNIGENNVKMSDVLFVKPSGKTVTGIGECLNTMVAKDDSIYNLQGEKLGKSKQQLGKGIYIINHKKVIIK